MTEHYEENILSNGVIQGHKYNDLKNIMEASDMNIRKALYRNSNSKK